jgi:hypothetical protein
MAEKNFLHKQVIVNQSMTGVGVITSQITSIRGFDNVFYDIQFTGTPTGTFSVQVSSSYDPLTNPNAIFIPLVLSPVPVASGSDGVIGIDINQEGAQWIKLVYTNSGGTGNLNAYVSAKAI